MSDTFSVEPDPPPAPAPEPPAPAPTAPQPAVEAPPPGAQMPPVGGDTIVDQPAVVGPPSGETPPADAWSLPMRRKLMAWLDAKGMGAASFVVVAVSVAGAAGACLAIGHLGFGALLGLCAIAIAWLARTPRDVAPGQADPALPFAHAVSEVVPALLAGGLALQTDQPFGELVRLALLTGLLLLPAFRHLDRARNLPKGPVFLSWAERLGLLMFGTLLGTPALAVLLVLIVVVLDLLVRLALIRPRNVMRPALPPGVASCFRPDGAILPPIRWAILIVGALLCIVFSTAFGTEAGWRF